MKIDPKRTAQRINAAAEVAAKARRRVHKRVVIGCAPDSAISVGRREDGAKKVPEVHVVLG